jgi:hypothetical protein
MESVNRAGWSSSKALDPGFTWFSSVLPGKFKIVTSSRAVYFVPNVFQFIIHQSLHYSRDDILTGQGCTDKQIYVADLYGSEKRNLFEIITKYIVKHAG